jgi:hypothetical protein
MNRMFVFKFSEKMTHCQRRGQFQQKSLVKVVGLEGSEVAEKHANCYV